MEISLRFGRGEQPCALPASCSGGSIESRMAAPDKSLERMVREALSQPIGSPRLSSLVKKGERVCIVFSDITRSWQQTGTYLPIIVEELEKGGVERKDITLLCALGTHRKHSEEEKRILAGSLYGTCAFVDHDCDDQTNLARAGVTQRGTEVEINRLAYEADQLILTGSIVFHFMAGYSGGRKALVPGIASRKTIMQNHALSLHPERGRGSHPLIGCDKVKDNPVHEDMEDAASLINPTFLVNIVQGREGPGGAVAGHFREAHEKGCALLRDFFRIGIREKRELVIASAGGFPGDINFYQAVKAMINGCEALVPGGTLILAAECAEGLGNPLMEEMIKAHPDMSSREASLRENYSIGRFIAYYACELASRYRVIMVTSLDADEVRPAGIDCFSTVQEAVDRFVSSAGGRETGYWLMPDASHSFPVVEE